MRKFDVTCINNTDGFKYETVTREAAFVKVDDHGNLCGEILGYAGKMRGGGLSWSVAYGTWTSFNEKSE